MADVTPKNVHEFIDWWLFQKAYEALHFDALNRPIDLQEAVKIILAQNNISVVLIPVVLAKAEHIKILCEGDAELFDFVWGEGRTAPDNPYAVQYGAERFWSSVGTDANAEGLLTTHTDATGRVFRGTSQDQPFSREVAIVDADGRTTRLIPDRSQAVKNHSPDGFNWGYSGSGSGQLALALLLEVTDNEGVALAHYHAFKMRFIAAIDSQHTDWQLPEHEIIGWLAAQGVVRPEA